MFPFSAGVLFPLTSANDTTTRSCADFAVQVIDLYSHHLLPTCCTTATVHSQKEDPWSLPLSHVIVIDFEMAQGLNLGELTIDSQTTFPNILSLWSNRPAIKMLCFLAMWGWEFLFPLFFFFLHRSLAEVGILQAYR